MDDNMKRKPRAISARPAVRPPGAGGTAASPSTLSGQGAQAPSEAMQAHEGGEAKSGPNVKTYIERQLKSVYDDVLNQPIPDRFLDLINALDVRVGGAAENGAAKSANAKSEGKE